MNEQLETIKAVANATEAAANATEKAIGATESFGKFISKFIKGSLEQGIGIVEDKLTYARWENQVRLINKVNEIMRANDIVEPRKCVPMKIAVPIFSNASLEEESFLQERWAKMLVNASCSSVVNVERSYISILEELSSLDVQNLEKIYKHEVLDINDTIIITDELPNATTAIHEKSKAYIKLNNEIEVSLQNLSRLGLILGAFTAGGYYRYDSVYQTYLGRAFINSCTITKYIDL